MNHLSRFWTVFRRAMMKLNRKFLPKLIRGLVSLSVLLGVCAMLFPLPIAPLPQNSPEKDSSEPFPCQNRPCGCRSADQCWKKCCCFNNAQKVAWAKANNVKVPEFVLGAAKKEDQSVVLNGRTVAVNPVMTRQTTNQSGDSRPPLAVSDIKCSAAKSAGCCAHGVKEAVVLAKPSCCKQSEGSNGGPFVTSKPGPCESSVASAKKSPEVQSRPLIPLKSKWVMAVHAAECQGQGPPAFCFPISIIPDRLLLVMPSVEVIESCIHESERLLEVSLRPPLPPPKIA